ncbi:hypothetical protein ACLK2E_11705 [Escherichia coli]
MPRRGTFPGLRRKRLTRATGPQTVMNRSPARGGESWVEGGGNATWGHIPRVGGVKALPGVPAGGGGGTEAWLGAGQAGGLS